VFWRNLLRVRITPIYDHTLEDLKAGVRTIVHQGGSWSGKTVNILPALATLAAEEDSSSITTVTSMSMPHLKGGALRDFEMFVYPHFKSAIKQYHRTDHVFTFKKGAIIEFKTFEDETKARGAKRKRLFVNEANTFLQMLFFQLHGRSDQTIIDYNPSERFWAHELLIDQEGVKTYISDHRHNPFLTEAKHAEIEAICTFAYDQFGKIMLNDDGDPVVLKGDYELWKVYARGITGNIEGVIFPNWEMIDDSLFPRNVDCIFSCDFGYTVDPTAIMKIARVGNTLFIKELSYRPGIDEFEIKAILAANGWSREDPLYCDHDADMIRLLRNAGVQYATPARKPPGSIYAGIQCLKGYDVKYTNSSKNLHRERSLYVWDKDKITGKSINVPIERHNHCFDSIRYGVYTKYLRNELKRA